MKKTAIFLLSMVLMSASAFSQAGKPEATPAKDRKEYVQQQMILLGLYTYGIKMELGKKVPNYDEMEFLADSLLSIAGDLKNTKSNVLHHKDLSDLLKNAEELKAFSQTDHAKARFKAQSLINSCGACHNRN